MKFLLLTASLLCPCVSSAGCTTKVCSGVYVQKAFQCSGTIVTGESCSPDNNQKIRLYLIRDGDDSQTYPLMELDKDTTTVTLNEEFNPGDTMVYHVNKNYDSKSAAIYCVCFIHCALTLHPTTSLSSLQVQSTTHHHQ